jgi:hypothetical protein
MNNDINKRVEFDAEGIPKGSNGAISVALAKVYNFSPKVIPSSAFSTVDGTTGQVTGYYADVSLHVLYNSYMYIHA